MITAQLALVGHAGLADVVQRSLLTLMEHKHLDDDIEQQLLHYLGQADELSAHVVLDQEAVAKDRLQ